MYKYKLKDKMLMLLGWPMLIAGLVLMVVALVTGLSHHNAVLFVCWLMVVAGAAFRIWYLKRQSKY
jgi:UDP-N-acetylmuramyl pentapeptide phosphotransferase/UDP-N-acetylglucosamine-1-phosphate transferase